MTLRRVRLGGVRLVMAARILMAVSLLIVLPTAILTLFWAFDFFLAPPVLQYFNVPFPVKTTPVQAGQSVSLIIERCSLDPFAPDPLIYTFTRELVNVADGTEIGIQNGATSMPHGCQVGDNAWINASNTIPRDVPEGTYYIRGTSVALGRLKVSIVQWQSEPFYVYAAPERGGQ